MLETSEWKYLPNRDALRKHWNWLRKWLLLSWKYCIVMLFVFVCLIPLMGTKIPVKSAYFHLNSHVPSDINATTNAKKPINVIAKDTTNGATSHITDQNNTVTNWNPPCEGSIVQGYGMGWSDVFADYRYSNGVMIKASTTRIRSIASGKVIEVDREKNYTVTIQHDKGYTSVISGIKKIDVSVGQQVTRQDVLGQVQRGQLLQLKILQSGRPLDPEKYLSLQ